jgi:VIT1/CCC1 family predicted Fe2+/Mn2+ transporter
MEGTRVITLLIYIVVMLIIVALLWWIISVLPLPPPAKTIAQVVCGVIVAIFLIYILLGVAGHGINGPLLR